MRIPPRAPVPALALVAAIALAGPAAPQQAQIRPADKSPGAGTTGAAARSQSSEPSTAAPPRAGVVLPQPTRRRTPDQCRAECAQDYYFCLAGDAADDCPAAWSQCRLSCNALSDGGG